MFDIFYWHELLIVSMHFVNVYHKFKNDKLHKISTSIILHSINVNYEV
jgi:hypothetical protein